MITTSATCQTFTPLLMHPVFVDVPLPLATCMCETSIPSSLGNIVPTPEISCTSPKTCSIGTTGLASAFFGPTTSLLPFPIPPITITAAASIF